MFGSIHVIFTWKVFNVRRKKMAYMPAVRGSPFFTQHSLVSLMVISSNLYCIDYIKALMIRDITHSSRSVTVTAGTTEPARVEK